MGCPDRRPCDHGVSRVRVRVARRMRKRLAPVNLPAGRGDVLVGPLKRFHAWFTEDIEMPRGWLYLALGFMFVETCDLIAKLIVWLV